MVDVFGPPLAEKSIQWKALGELNNLITKVTLCFLARYLRYVRQGCSILTDQQKDPISYSSNST